MKRYISFVLLLSVFISSQSCVAQSAFLKSRVEANGKTFICKKMDAKIYIYNSKNKKNLGPGNLPKDASLTSINFIPINKIEEIFYNIFTTPELKRLVGEGSMIIHFDINNKGDILQLAFLLSPDTKITPKQLSLLEDKIKKEVKFSFKDNSFSNANYIMFNYSIPFKKILNHEKLINPI